MDNQKVHIGFMLNLKKETDREIHSILKNLPPCEDVSKYIRKAILAYNGGTAGISASPVDTNSDVTEVIRSLSREISSIKDEMDRLKESTANKVTVTENKKADTERQNSVSNDGEKSSQKQEKKPEKRPSVKEETKEEVKATEKEKPNNNGEDGGQTEAPAEAPVVKEEPKDENDIAISTDTKPSKVSYNDFLGDFFG